MANELNMNSLGGWNLHLSPLRTTMNQDYLSSDSTTCFIASFIPWRNSYDPGNVHRTSLN
ncbi:unnamed protein product, partial [Nesidiocoris tenuis]